MADILSVSNHLCERNGVWQFVRRVPKDLSDAFTFSRVQKSLGTNSERTAREAAVRLDRHWDKRFAEARARKGLQSKDEAGVHQLDTSGWVWPDWEALVSWFAAALAEEDWQVRLLGATGEVFALDPDPAKLPWRDASTVRANIDRGQLLRTITVSDYTEQRAGFVQAHVRRLGINLSKTSAYRLRFMSACLAAELAFLDLFHARESRQGGIGNPHPDSIGGPWQRRPVLRGMTPPVAPASATILCGKTLEDCLRKWVENRETSKKIVRLDHLRDARTTIAAFESHSSVVDIAEIRRRHVLAFRDHLSTTTKYAVQTVNKKISFVTTLMATGLNAGWIETSLGEKLVLAVPEDQDRREPYGDDHLRTIFSDPIFTERRLQPRVKAGAELQFWLPLISCLHGMISSEIIQLGPDTVVGHPDAPDVLCFNVTTAGDRRTKTLARRRWVPVRHELINLGFRELVRAAGEQGSPFLWTAMSTPGNDVARVSGYFSAFWTDFSRKTLKIEDQDLSLYSFRHTFQDRLGKAGYGETVKKALMGHSETGMTGRYGTKKRPRAVDIAELDTVIQTLDWPFLKSLR